MFIKVLYTSVFCSFFFHVPLPLSHRLFSICSLLCLICRFVYFLCKKIKRKISMLCLILLIIHIIKEMDAVQLSPGERNYCAEYHIAVSVLFYFIALLIVSFCLPPSYFYSLSYCSPQSPIKAQLHIFSRYVSTGCSLNIVGFFFKNVDNFATFPSALVLVV